MAEKIAAGGPGSGRTPWKNPMFEIKPGIYRGHLPKDATPEMRRAQAIKDRATVKRSGNLRKTLESNIRSSLPVD